MTKNFKEDRGRTHLGAEVPVDLRDGLRTLARRDDRSLSSVVRMALAAHIQREQIDETLADVKTKAAHFRPIEGGTNT